MRKQYPPNLKAKIVLELLKEEKSIHELAAEHEIHVTQLRQWRQRALDELPNLFSRERQVGERELQERDQLIEKLYRQIGHLSTELAWLQKMVTELSVAERRTLVERDSHALSLRQQARLLGLNRTSLYYHPRPISATELLLKRRIDEIHTALPFYGSRRLTQALGREGHSVSRRRCAATCTRWAYGPFTPSPISAVPTPTTPFTPICCGE